MGLLRQLRQLDERCVSPFEPRRNTQKQKRNVRGVGDVNWVTQANATQSKLAYVDDDGHAIIKVDNTTFVPYNYKRDSVSSPLLPSERQIAPPQRRGLLSGGTRCIGGPRHR